MNIFEAIVLGIIQGLTEFLPVSSSGHLELAKAIFGNQDLGAEESMMMTVMLHFATALSTCVIFRKDIGDILKGLFQFKWNEETEFSVKIVLSMIPAAFVGVFLDDQIEAFFGGAVLLVGCMLLVTAVLLLLADKAKNTSKSVGYKEAIIVGIAQAIAILPGISRSGATISTSVLLGIDREKSARFSFLMVVPLIFGKIAKDLLDARHEIAEGTFQLGLEPTIIGAGFIAAFLSGMLACQWMIALVKKSKLQYFSIWCALVGSIAIIYSLMN
ncbi:MULTISPECIES: undecaprenyl-diphosphate phosphatase [Flammeovirga]|uniref:Undecaprenyl-diphosphatase n=1 Tax=Flammeovirga agarivorans TaxID=2726742 RepID=A0A7X8XU86_9BACT|nr:MULTISPECIES: undecaprenyl-diphosphate phosphatase [Flammeovirga]NLR90004.1 undecaprenyl-diphosphate phosphatase [Flammeovirga agarivorans]